MNFFAELRRRNVIRMAGLYLVVAWLVVQVAETVLPAFDVPGWVLRAIIIVFALGFLPALAFAWVFELTPEGLKREGSVDAAGGLAPQTGRRMDRLLLVAMALALGYFAFDKFVMSPARVAAPQTQVLSPADAARAQVPGLADKSIAVLPFENLSSDPDNAYFAIGMQDEILTRLSKISALRVTSRTSTMNIASKPANLPEIAALLGVSAILEGSVQKSGNAVRINVQLIRAATDEHLWAESYDRPIDDLFAVQAEVARAVADAMSAALTGGEQVALNARSTENAKAYEFYLRGLAMEARFSDARNDIQQRIDAYQQAVDLDPQFGLAWAHLAAAQTELYFGHGKSAARLALIQASLENAQELAPGTTETWAALGVYRYMVTADYDGAFEAYSKALETSPNSGLIVYLLGNVRRRQGQWDEALPLQQKATELDPLATNTWWNLGSTLRALRRYDEAQAAFDRGLAALPDDLELVGQKLVTFAAVGDLVRAEAYLQSLPAALRDSVDFRLGAADISLLKRDYPAAIAVAKSLLENRGALSPQELNGALGILAEAERLSGSRSADIAHLTEGRDQLRALRENGNMSPYVSMRLSRISALLGDKQASYREADEAAKGLATDAIGLPQAIQAQAFARMMAGDKAQAVAFLTQAQSLPMLYGDTPALLRLGPSWDPLRDEPGFAALTEGDGLPLKTSPDP